MEILKKYTEIVSKLKTIKRLRYVFNFSIALFNSLTLLALALILFTAFELFLQGDTTFRTTLISLAIAIFLISFAYLVSPTFIEIIQPKKRLKLDQLAFAIGQNYPDVRDTLSNSLQLMEKINELEGISKIFVEKAFENAYKLTSNKDFTIVLEKSKLRKSITRFAVSILLFALLLLLNSSFSFAFYRLVNFNQSFIPPAPFSLKIHPKYATLKRGESVEIVVKATGTPPKTLNLFIREFQQKEFESMPLTLDSGNIFRYNIPSLKNSIKFYAEAEWLTEKVSSDIGEIVVVEHPIIESFNGTIILPSYTKKPPIEFNDQNADITTLIGSTIKLEIITSKTIRAASIVFVMDNSADTTNKSNKNFKYYPMSVKGKQASGNFPAFANGFYFVEVEDYDSLKNDNPILNRIVVNQDNSPEITLLEPTTDVLLSENALLPMMFDIYDDFGFSTLRLNFRLTKSEYTQAWTKFRAIDLPFPSDKSEARIAYIWDLNKINISPSDEYEFFLEVFDNDKVRGPKSARSPTLKVKLPSLEEALDYVDKAQQTISKELDKTLKQANEIKEQMEQIQRELQKNQNKKDLSWEEKKKVENLLNQQKELTKKLEDLQKNLSELTQKLTENNMISQETLQKYLELQKLLQEVKSPELERMQRQFEEALRKLSPEEIQEAIKNFKFDEQQFRKNIERTIKILKRLQLEQKVDALINKSQELLEKQAELEKKLQNANPNDADLRNSLAEKQKQLQKELNAIQQELDRIKDLMQEIGKDMPLDDLEQAISELAPNESSKDMEQAENNIRSGNFNKAQQSQRKVQNRISNFLKKMKDIKDELNTRITKETIQKLQKALNDVLELAKEQSEIRKQTQQIDQSSTKIPELARQEANLADALINLTNSLFELSMKSFAVTPEMARQLGQALESIQNSIQQLANRNLNSAISSQNQALQALNQTAIQIQSMLSSIQGQGACENPGMGEGKGKGANFMQQLQQIASAQQSINQMTQQLGNTNPGTLTQEQQAQLARIVSEQGRALQALQELSNQKGTPPPDKRILGSLEKVIKDMNEVLSDLRSGNITQETLKRQERILSRLLDATLSIYERDFEERRESTPGKELPKKAPPELSLKQLSQKSLEQYLNELKNSYTKDYEEIVRKYFNLIQNMIINPTY